MSAMTPASPVLPQAIQPFSLWRGRSCTTAAAPNSAMNGSSAWSANGMASVLAGQRAGEPGSARDARRRDRALERDFLGAVGADAPSQLELLVAPRAEFTELRLAVWAEDILRV